MPLHMVRTGAVCKQLGRRYCLDGLVPGNPYTVSIVHWSLPVDSDCIEAKCCIDGNVSSLLA